MSRVQSATQPYAKASALGQGNLAASGAEKTFPEQVWDWLACFRSIHLAIVLLSLLALATLAGVLLPQEGVVELSQIKQTYGSNFRVMKAMGLFNVYSSYWFITLEVLFFLNLLCGSFQWLKPAYLAATRKVFCGPEHILASPNHFGLSTNLTPEQARTLVARLLKKHRYGIHVSPTQPDRLYASKGNFSRFGPVVAHFGILMLLVASVFGAFTGFKAQQMAVPGDTFGLSEVGFFKTNIQEAVWQGHVPDWKVRVDDFRIEYYPNDPTTAKQFYADLSIVDEQNQVLKQKTISVNDPLQYGDVTIYQASFNPTGKLQMLINGKPRTVEINAQFQDRKVCMIDLGDRRSLVIFPFFVQQDPGVTGNYLVAFLKTDQGFVGEAPGKMPDNLRLTQGQSGALGGVQLQYIKPEYATGLQIKKAPEVPWMYLSFGIICLGTVMCIFSQRRLWVAVRQQSVLQEQSGQEPMAHGQVGHTEVLFQFKTNKARLSFLKELQRLQTELQHNLLPPDQISPARSMI